MSGSSTMRTLAMHLWKEWRDYRSVLLGMVLVVPPLLALLGLALPQKMFDHKGFADYTAVACLATFVISLSTDLVSGEARRGHRRFLERLPYGLGPPFVAKLVLFVTGAAIFTVYGYAAGAETCYLVARALPDPLSLGVTTGVLAVAALWAFAVSCALPRGALSLPSLAALALLLGLPVLVCRQIEPTTGSPSWWRLESAALWGAGAVIAGWAAFRHARFLRAGSACFAVGAVCAAPYWVDAVHYVVCPEPQIADGCLGEDGHYAFIDCVRRLPPGVTGGVRPLPRLIVDLRKGTAFEAAPGDRGWFHGLSDGSFPQRYISIGCDLFDARTTERARPGQEELREARRSAAPWRLPDGRRVWSFAHRLEADAADGGVEVLEAQWEAGSPCGLGFQFPRRFYDLTRRRFYDRDAIGLRRYNNAWIRPGRWLVRKSYGSAYELLDPDSREFTPAAGIASGDQVYPMLDDCRMIVRREQAVLLVDPVTGVAVSVPALEGAWVNPSDRCRTPDGRQVFQVSDRGRGALARFDPATGTFARTAWVKLEGYRFSLGCPTDDEAIVHDGRAIYRLRFGSDEREEIWRAR